MPTDPQRCEPPPEHRGHRWHWLSFSGDAPRPVEWSETSLSWHMPAGPMPAYLGWRLCWRYLGPAIPPEAG